MSNNKHKYFNKVPPFKPDPYHYTRKHHSWNDNDAYDTDDDAWEYLNQNPKLNVLVWHTYLCNVCSKWHIGKLHKKMSL